MPPALVSISLDGRYHPPTHVLPAKVLTHNGIIAKYNITREELLRMEKELRNMKLIDVLFHYPDGVTYDLLLQMVATGR